MILSHHSSCSYYISTWHVQERNQFGQILHIRGTLETYMSPVNHTTSGGWVQKRPQFQTVKYFCPKFYSGPQVYLRGVSKIIGIDSGSVITCKRWQVFGWKVHFWHYIFRQILGFPAYNWTIYWTLDINLTQTHHTIIGVFIGFVCLSTPRPFLGPRAPNLAGTLGRGAESGLRHRFPWKHNCLDKK